MKEITLKLNIESCGECPVSYSFYGVGFGCRYRERVEKLTSVHDEMTKEEYERIPSWCPGMTKDSDTWVNLLGFKRKKKKPQHQT